MRELTDELPKPMLRVHGKPILEHILTGLKMAGILDACIVVGWKSEVIKACFGDGSRLGMRIEYAHQEVQDGTGKAPEVARAFIGSDSFLLTYGDILVRPETYAEMISRFGEDAFSGLLTVTQGEDVTKGAINFFDEAFRLKKIVEKPSISQLEALQKQGWLKSGDPAWYNAGIYIFKPVVFEFTARLHKSPRGEYEITDAISALVDAGHALAGCRIQGRWVDVRDPEVLRQLEAEAAG